ncbi:hypothetical protein KY332_01670 [Candidatus Woesearchaeota archaeon]|nr:hypothetical protein [Candidatus Woesearchaeota archaeon]
MVYKLNLKIMIILLFIIISINGCRQEISPELKEAIEYCKDFPITGHTRTKNSCYARFAIDKLNSNVCSLIDEDSEEFRNGCYQFLANELNDSSICNNIENSDFGKFSCIAIIEQNSAPCNKIKNEQKKGDCLYIIAKNNKDPSLCKEIKNDESRYFCYQILASAKNDSSLCYNIEDDIQRSSCLNNLKT